MYENFEKLLKEHNVTAYRVSKETGVTTATLTSWKQGKYTPKPEKLQKIADYFGVTVDYLMTGNDTTQSLYTCPDCGLSYVPTEYEDAKYHVKIHEAWKLAVNKFGALYCNRSTNENIKAQCRNIRNNADESFEKRYDAEMELFRCFFSDSVSANEYDLNHVSFEEYIAMLLSNPHYTKYIAEDVYQKLKEVYGIKHGNIKDRIYQIPVNTSKVLAAHFDGDEYTEEELDEIRQFAQFVKSKRES